MTLVGLFSGAKPAATPVGSATTTDGGADFAALLGAVAAPLLFAGTPTPVLATLPTTASATTPFANSGVWSAGAATTPGITGVAATGAAPFS